MDESGKQNKLKETKKEKYCRLVIGNDNSRYFFKDWFKSPLQHHKKQKHSSQIICVAEYWISLTG